MQLTAEERRVVLARDAHEWARDSALLLTAAILGVLSFTLARNSHWMSMAVTFLMAAAAMGTYVYFWLPRRRKGTDCEKEVIQGIITRKRRTWGKRPRFYVSLGECEVEVDREEWPRLRVGTGVELHRATVSDKAFAIYRHRTPPLN